MCAKNYPNIKRVGVLSTTGAIKAQIYPTALAIKGIQTILPSKDVQEKVLHPAIFERIMVLNLALTRCRHVLKRICMRQHTSWLGWS
ncbi:MAG: hypothetical protein CM1200mP6_08230 [Anaerolineaceae bacterium]|nr:MAG: hypothetical protein CM1200mP6_08230 [Anaerolineaceae bacterium]